MGLHTLMSAPTVEQVEMIKSLWSHCSFSQERSAWEKRNRWLERATGDHVVWQFARHMSTSGVMRRMCVG